MHRRRFLAVGAAAGTAGLAGCRSLFQTRSAREPPLVEDRPDAAYYPTHVDGMGVAGTAETDDYGIALSYTYPHRFWRVTGSDRTKVEIRQADSVHLMATVWDRETETVVPSNSVSITATLDDESLDKRMWPMLSQNMGVHAGDNVELPGQGTYDVEIEVGPLSARSTGAFRDRFAESQTGTVEFTFDRSELRDLSFERLDDQQGQPGAVEPMEMDAMPVSTLPDAESMPGTLLGTTESADATFVALARDEPPAGIDADGEYLAVSPRTPHNRFPLPMTTMSAALSRDGETAFEGPLNATFDSELGYHYGAAVDSIAGELTLTVDAPPQIFRHEGYETAFFGFEEMSLDLEQ